MGVVYRLAARTSVSLRMNEIRVDPFSGRRVILAPGRAERPGAGLTVTPPAPVDPDRDPFAPGHESETAPEVFALRLDGSAPDTPGWTVRVVPNLYPALTGDAPDPEPEATPDLFWAGSARGAHEVIVNAPEPVASLADLEAAPLAEAVEVWRERMRAHPDASCLHLFVNEGAGASLPHTHAQLLALDFVPADIARERERFRGYATRTMGGNLLSDLVQQEVRRRERIVAIDSEAVLMSAYAARVPYQMTLAPRTARMRFQDDGPTGAALLHDALGRLRRALGAMPALNLWIRTAPRGAEHYCWRIDILPRLFGVGSIELGAGVDVNPVTPEAAAAALRGD
jgi:UDPglucose--hexose-1-phosphate uridylyltransferase